MTDVIIVVVILAFFSAMALLVPALGRLITYSATTDEGDEADSEQDDGLGVEAAGHDWSGSGEWRS